MKHLSPFLVLVAFQSANAASPTIVNGIATDGYQSVKKLTWKPNWYTDAMCSSVQIGEGTIITAVHCTRSDDGIGEDFKPNKITIHTEHGEVKPYKIIRAPLVTLGGRLNYDNDLAILLFEEPAKTFYYMPVNSHPIQLGDEVTLVGFGKSDPDAWIFDGSGTKRYGKNNVDLILDGIFYLTGMHNTGWFEKSTGENSTFQAGDSGGAVVNTKHELVGVISAGGKMDDDQDLNLMVKLSGPVATQLFEDAAAAGARLRIK